MVMSPSSIITTDSNSVPEARSLDLAGTWTYRLDPDSVGEMQQWFASDLTNAGEVSLPGSLQQQGIGDPVTVDTAWTGSIIDQSFFTEDRYAPYRDGEDVSVPFWLQPRVYYRGAAWFQREIHVPDEWDARSVELELERVHWESTVWLDEKRVGSQDSLSTAHRYDLGRLSPGIHRLTIRVDNRTVIDVGPNSHAVSDHTQSNWNGIIGHLTLHPRSEVTLGQVRIFPDVAGRAIDVRIDITSGTEGAQDGKVRLAAHRRGAVEAPTVAEAIGAFTVDHGEDLGSRGLLGGGTHLDVRLELGDDAETWDEFDPALYELEVQLSARVGEEPQQDSARIVFGLREMGIEGTQVTINGRCTFIRGSLESCVFPLTGYPPTDVDAWRHIIAVAQAHGLNLLRMHSWCPPEAAFVAADEAGIYLQVEGPFWANQGSALGEGRPVDAFIHDETRRILREYGNHPSFIMMAHGNEPGGRDAEFLASWVRLWQTQDPRRLYTSAAGWPAIAQNDFDNIPDPRTHRWGEGLESRLNSEPPNTLADYSDWVESCPRPIISHEIGQWCVYPDFGEMDEYTGLMQSKNFGIFADMLESAGMADQARDFLSASGRLQALCYKEEIESAMRTEGFGGFHLLGLTDFPGQGTALVGVLNPFWESKGYTTPEGFSRFCGPTVPLARLSRRVWSTEDEQPINIQVAHFGPEPLTAKVRWMLRDQQENLVSEGIIADEAQIEIGNRTRLGPVTIPPGLVTAPARLRLVVEIDAGEGGTFENDWDVWVYPEADPTGTTSSTAAPSKTTSLSPVTTVEEAVHLAEAGGTVLLEIPASSIDNDISLGFTPVFWNTAWTRGQAPHTLGLLHDPAHPLFEHFPTEGATNWQWWEPLRGSRPMLMNGLPTGLRPLVQVIDTWFEARPLGALFEARLGAGRIMVTSLNLQGDSESTGGERLSARQLRRSLLAYMSGPDFAPEVSISVEELGSVLR